MREVVGTQPLLFADPDLIEVTERELAGLAIALGAATTRSLSKREISLAKRARSVPKWLVEHTAERILECHDPLGDHFARARSPERRRSDGATFTPSGIVESMVAWCSENGDPETVVDPGCGSARFMVSAGRSFPSARLLGVETDPLAALLARAHVQIAGMADRAELRLADYRSADLRASIDDGQALFIGNPPYIRHHQISSKWKRWLVQRGQELGLNTSTLAGLHVYFLVSTAQRMRPGDYGCFITAAEWLDVNYGRMVRELFLGPLGGQRLVVVEPMAKPFPDAATTAVITCFRAQARPRSVFIQRIANTNDLGSLSGQRRVRRERFESEPRWSHLTRRTQPAPEGFIELGEICRVHRGQVTGANDVWIAGAEQFELPQACLFRTVTRARELFTVGPELQDASALRHVIDLPIDLDTFRTSISKDEQRAVDRFLKFAKSHDADKTYIARNRKRWWSVGLRAPAPILATYMARRPPAFVLNTGGARHINIAHGLYPRERLAPSLLRSLVEYLSTAVSLVNGRTYAGGLTKFEPREMERILVPNPSVLRDGILG